MQGSDGLFNDGLDLGTCKNNGLTAWTYNQVSVIASGLGALYVATGCSNETHLTQAQVSLNETMHSPPPLHVSFPCILTPPLFPYSKYSR
ncbi:hypothetical protein OG21DRAFT_1506932, partial [Imleria badia]